GFGHRDGKDGLAADAFGQKPVELLLGSEALEIGTDQTAVQRVEPALAAGARGLLDDDLLVAEVRIAHSAVFLFGPDHQEAEITGLLECAAVDDAGLPPRLHMRHDLAGEELPVGFAEDDLIFGKAAHHSPNSALKQRG